MLRIKTSKEKFAMLLEHLDHDGDLGMYLNESGAIQIGCECGEDDLIIIEPLMGGPPPPGAE